MKGETAGRNFGPKAREMSGPAASAPIATTGNISAAVINTALFVSCSLSSLFAVADNLGNRSNPTMTGNIMVFSARTWLIE